MLLLKLFSKILETFSAVFPASLSPSFKEFPDAFDKREAIEVELKIGGEGGYTRKGSAVITDFPEEYQQDSAVSFSISLQGASPLTKTSNAGKVVSK